MSNIDRFEFHESGVLKFIKQDNTVVIYLEGVTTYDNNKCNVTIRCFGVSKIEIDHKLSESVFMEAEDGEVFTLEIEDKKLIILIEWCNYKSKEMFIKYYEIDCEGIQIDVVNIDPF